MLFQKSKIIKVFDAEVEGSMSRAEIENEIKKISNTVEIEKYKNPLQRSDIIEVSRGKDGKQTIYEIVFEDDKLTYVAKSDRIIIFENGGSN